MSIDRRITDPHEVPFLEWYHGLFDAVYIALHPFCTIENLDPATAHPSMIVVSRDELPPGRLDHEKIAAEKSKDYSIDIATVKTEEKRVGQDISWEYVRIVCGFDSLAQLDRALMTTIGALNYRYAHPGDAGVLKEFCAARQIFLPTEDTFPPRIEARLATMLERFGIEDVFFADEFDLDMVKVSVSSLKQELPWWLSALPKLRPNKIYPENHSFLAIVSFDNFYTAICGNSADLAAAKVDELFEGFWCDATTRPDWWRLDGTLIHNQL